MATGICGTRAIGKLSGPVNAMSQPGGLMAAKAGISSPLIGSIVSTNAPTTITTITNATMIAAIASGDRPVPRQLRRAAAEALCPFRVFSRCPALSAPQGGVSFYLLAPLTTLRCFQAAAAVLLGAGSLAEHRALDRSVRGAIMKDHYCRKPAGRIRMREIAEKMSRFRFSNRRVELDQTPA
jgi:hypothetical protein